MEKREHEKKRKNRRTINNENHMIVRKYRK